MRRLFAVFLLWTLGPGAARAADYLNGDWYILTGTRGVSSSDPTGELAKALAGQNDLKCVAFTADGAWSFLFAAHGIILGGGSPASLATKVPELWKLASDFRALAFRPQGGWVLLYDKNGFAADGIPAGVRARLEQAQKAGAAFRSFAFTPDGGWVLLTERGFEGEGLPKPLSDKLAERSRQGVAVRCVAFTSQGDWFLLDDRNEFVSSNADHPAHKKLAELRAQGQALRWVAFAPGEYTHGYVLDHQPVRRIRAVQTLTLDRPEGGVDRWVVLAPQGPELPRQREVKVALEPAALSLPDAGALKGTGLVSRVTDRPKGFTARATYEMTLYTNRLVPRTAGQPAPERRLPPELLAAYTRVGDDIKAKMFQDFLDRAGLRRGPKEGAVTFARRAFLYVARHFKYGPGTEGVDTVQSGVGDCGGLSWVFVRALRANGVPARALLGRWADSEAPAQGGKPYDGRFHVKPEFFVDGLGWVGADMSGGVTAEGNPFICFGTEGGDFVVLDLDVERVVQLLPEDPPAKVGGGQGMGWWWYTGVAGKPPRTEDHWTVETLDVHPAAKPYRSRWKRPPPTGPHATPKKPIHLMSLRSVREEPPAPTAAPAPRPGVDPPAPKSADAAPPETRARPKAAEDAGGAEFPWLLLGGAGVGVGLLVVLVVFVNRRLGG